MKNIKGARIWKVERNLYNLEHCFSVSLALTDDPFNRELFYFVKYIYQQFFGGLLI